MSLTADFQVHARDLVMRLTVDAATTTAIVGANGSGKSTVLQVLAGLLRADSGHATHDGHVLFDDRTWVPPHRRRLALLAQQPRLFPRMSALANVEFSLRARGASRHEATKWLELLNCGDLAARKPAELSGGQAQRVAIARALAAEPALLLLDEPLAALDPPVAMDIRHALHQVLATRTALLVTHEPLDAALLADDVVVLHAGRVVESGPVSEVMRNPRTAFAAEMFGLNFLTGIADTAQTLATDWGAITGLGTLSVGAPAIAAFPPSAVAVFTQPPHGSPRNVVPAHVVSLVPRAQLVRIVSDAFAADLTPAAVAELGLHPGMRVFLSVKAAEVRLYSQ